MADRMLVATRKGLFDVRRRDGRWQIGPPRLHGQPLPYAVRDPRDGRVWASIDHGHWGCKLAVSDDDGQTFEEATPPRYPEATGAAARYYWVIQPGHADRPGAMWIGTEPGGLFDSEDGGATWRLVESLWDLRVKDDWMGGGREGPGIHSICLDPRDPDRLHVGISCAGVLTTEDGGATWAYRNEGVPSVAEPGEPAAARDPHFVVRCPTAPDVLWQANHVGVFRSTDDARTWEELTDKPLVHFGFPVAVHPAKADTAWIVPMDADQRRTSVDGILRVMRTDDGGATWAEQREGLPDVHAWDFPFRHALDVGPDGDTLAFGTTSGNLYASDDGGASWEALAQNLPPVYSVRFA